MAVPRLLLASLLLLGLVLAVQGRRRARTLLDPAGASNRRHLLKEAGNEIEHGPAYPSHHKQHLRNKAVYHLKARKQLAGPAKRQKYGHKGEQLANTAFDHDDITLQRLDSAPRTKKKVAKSFTQMEKKKQHKPSKKMDKMYKKMLEKQRLHLKKEKFEKLHKKKQTP